MITKVVWRQALPQWHTAWCVRLLCLGSSRRPQAARRGVPTMRCYNAIASGARPAHAAVPPTLRSGGAPVVQRLTARLHDAVRVVPFTDGPPGAPRGQPDPPRPVECGALYGMRSADDGGPGRHASRLSRWDGGVRLAERPADGLNGPSESGCTRDGGQRLTEPRFRVTA